MEGIAPSLSLAIDLKYGLLQGLSCKESLRRYCDRQKNHFAKYLELWLISRDHSQKRDSNQLKTDSQRALLTLIDHGLKGTPIYDELNLFIEMTLEASLKQIDSEHRIMPYKALVPLLFFQFPAILILVFGPLIAHLPGS